MGDWMELSGMGDFVPQGALMMSPNMLTSQQQRFGGGLGGVLDTELGAGIKIKHVGLGLLVGGIGFFAYKKLRK